MGISGLETTKFGIDLKPNYGYIGYIVPLRKWLGFIY